MSDQSEDSLAWCQATAGFRQRLDGICNRLRLAEYLTRNELGLLFVAAYYATLCNIAFNGFGGCDGMIKPQRELHRIGLERRFMIAWDMVRRSAGWKSLPKLTKESAARILLSVYVIEANLA